MQYTPNFEFELPESNDYAAPPNDNFTKVDTELVKRPAVDAETGKLPESVLPLSNADAKDTPVDADSLTLVDSADSNKTKRLLWSRVKAVLATVFAPLNHNQAWSTITGTPTSFPPSAHAATHKTGGADALIPSDIGAAASSHNHDASSITSGILSLARGGTGVSSLAELVAALGAVQISTGSYVGTGAYGSGSPTLLTVGFAPKVVIITVDDNDDSGSPNTMVFIQGQSGASGFYNPSTATVTNIHITWGGNTVSWYSSSSATMQMNAGKTYRYAVIG